MPVFICSPYLDKNRTTADVDTLLGLVGYRGIKGESDDVTHRSADRSHRGGVGCRRNSYTRTRRRSQRIVTCNSKTIQLHASWIRIQFDRYWGDQAFWLWKFWIDHGVNQCCTEDMGISHSESHRIRLPQLSWLEKCLAHTSPGSRWDIPSLEGLRLALIDGAGFSIRRSDDPESFDPFTPAGASH